MTRSFLFAEIIFNFLKFIVDILSYLCYNDIVPRGDAIKQGGAPKMTRFEMEITGKCGEFWKKEAMKKLDSIREDYAKGEIIYEDDNAVKWATNGSYLPAECVEHMVFAGLPVNVEATAKKRKAQISRDIKAYIKAMENSPADDEERYEMEAAFGKGTTVVNVLTGRTTRL